MWKPELLSPAGSLDKLKIAVSYGADAVYLAGQKFGLRSAAENFSLDELEEGIDFAHARKAKVFVVLNGFLHDADLPDLAPFVKKLAAFGADGVIASDLGVVSIVAAESALPIHLSTQASCLNEHAAKFWKHMGVTRLILGREVSIRDGGAIKRATNLEVELFIHGSMCMAYSGNCTISNFTKGRDSNRGGCAQSCRFEYRLDYATGETRSNAFFMSSNDLLGLEQLPLFWEEQIDSVKIEGRMRSPLYAGVVSKVYREALDHYASSRSMAPELLARWQDTLSKLPHRDYMSGNLVSAAGRESVFNKARQGERPTYQFLGVVRKVDDGKQIFVEVRTPFNRGDEVELIGVGRERMPVALEHLSDVLGGPLERARLNTLVRIPYVVGAKTGQILTKVSAS